MHSVRASDNAGVAIPGRNDSLLYIYSLQNADVAQGGQNDVYAATFTVRPLKTTDALRISRASTRGHVKTLTFYDDDPEAQHSFAVGTDDNISKIADAWSTFSMKSFWAIPGSGVTGGMKGPPVWLRSEGKLNATWKEFMDASLDRVVPLIKEGAVLGVYLGDEVICSGITMDDVAKVAEHTRSRIGKQALIYRACHLGLRVAVSLTAECVALSVNECGGGRSWEGKGITKHVPAAIDIISIDTCAMATLRLSRLLPACTTI